ncbi:hypothetical protein LCGC14_2324490 [marine sediment metagenome]|uniref:Uncharacterized protein n=1 Tax=marine sediment metagenome TaxID=412755 RepID=A0A0F9CHE5_9ZZZZ
MSLTVSAGDTINNWGDTFAAAAGMLISKSDNIDNLADTLNKFSAWSISFGDKLSLKDRLFADFLLTLDPADDLNTWSDALAKLNLGLYKITNGDNLNNLSDLLVQRLDHRIKLGSAIVGHADKVEIEKELRLALSDTLDNWLDAIIINPVLDLTISLADTLSMSDNLALLLSTRATTGLKASFDDYIRKYLNDPKVES